MIPELGHYALILALFVALAQTHPLLARRAAFLLFFLCFIVFSSLIWSFAVSDFTVVLVAEHSHTLYPLPRKFSQFFMTQQGLMIFFIYFTSTAGAGLALARPHLAFLRIAGLTGAWLIGGALLLHPFDRIYPPPFDGVNYDPLAVQALSEERENRL